MSQRLFNLAKIPVQLDAVSFGMEKRRGEEVKVAVITCRVQPFDAKFATALDGGVGDDSNIRSTVFSLNTTDPKANFTRHDFTLGIPRQQLVLFASADTPDSRVALDQVKIFGTYVRTQKDMPNALALVFKGSLGPVSRDELEFLNLWFRSQMAVTFKEAEKSIAFESLEEPDDDEPDDAGDDQPALPAHDFTTDAEGREVETASDGPVNRPLHSHTSRKKKKARR